MTSVPLPHGLRVLHLSDRLILHDISFALRPHSYDRNSLIDAANSVHHRQNSSPVSKQLLQLDLPTLPAHTSTSPPLPNHRYLVLPFAPEHAPYNPPPPFIASTPEQAGIAPSTDAYNVPVDAAAAFLGLLPLHSGIFAVLATQVRRAGTHPTGPILALSKICLIRLGDAWQSKEDKEAASAVAKLLESGAVYYSLHTDITLAAQRRGSHDKTYPFWWNFPLSQRLPQNLRCWTIRAVYGFVGTHVMRFQSDAVSSGTAEFCITVISRRSRLRAGTRYITRGVDALGNVANSVETEQLVWRDGANHVFASFVIIRGSIPVFWRQNNGIAKPSPELDDSLVASRRAFARHFDSLKDTYGFISAVSLVDKHGSESVLASAFERHFELFLRPFDRQMPPKLVPFDFHSHCSGKEYERGLAVLLDRLRDDISHWGFYHSDSTVSVQMQRGVFRVNCVDCLDRTNVVQSMIARVVLSMQLETLFNVGVATAPSKYGLRLYSESEDRYKHLWGDNADAVSKQYSGTGALKTDFTRTGKRSTTGVIGDGMKSVMRMYYKNFIDEGRQEVIDMLCGNVAIRAPASGPKSELVSTESETQGKDVRQFESSPSLRKSQSTSLWYSFEALRINASGDKQSVYIELHDHLMNVVTQDGICLEFPRKALTSWSKRDDAKLSDRKTYPARLRLVYRPSSLAPATASPLDLQFRGGTTARENFLRALMSWSRPETAALLAKKPIRVRVVALLNVGEHYMNDWGLAPDADAKEADEIIALVLPETISRSRSWGLAAVPVDVDFSDYVLVGACAASDQGPAIAVLTSKRIVPTVMMVSETTTLRDSSSVGGGAAAIALQACGTSFCFVSARANGPADLHAALTSLKLGRQSFDVTNQFHHFTVAGLLGDMKWHHSKNSRSDGKTWVNLGDGSSCCSLRDGLSVMRNSFPSLMYNDNLVSRAKGDTQSSSAKNGKLSSLTTMEDGMVEGRTGPQLPKNLAKCVVSVSGLRADDVLMPRGIEHSSQMTCVLALYCDLATMEGVATRPTQRPSSYPEWKDTLKLVMMPSDLDEIHESFILGQIVVPTPLSDPIAAGYFVLPIAFAKSKNGDFEVPCRLAGKLTAMLYGKVRVIEGEGEVVGGLATVPLQRTGAKSARLATSGRNSLPPIPTYETQETEGTTGSHALNRRPHSTALPPMDGLEPQYMKKGTIEEVNGKLNAARRKGSKQMKSVVSRLSSLLNQPSASNAPSTQVSRAPAFADFDSDGKSPRNHTPLNEADGENSHATELPSPTVVKNTRNEKNVGAANDIITTGGGYLDGKQSKNVAMTSENMDDLSSFSTFQAAPDENMRSKRPPSWQQKSDSLLEGLEAGRTARHGVSHQQKPPTHYNEDGLDSLLSGLADQKVQSAARMASVNDEDEWGDFEKAASPAGRDP